MAEKVQMKGNANGIKGLLSSVFLFKIICVAVMMVMVIVVGDQWSQIRLQQSEAQAWSRTNDYAVFYPHMVGYDTYEGQERPIFPQYKINEATTLYDELNRRGSIFIDAEPYEEGSLNKHPEGLPTPTIRVNVNYLKQYPIVDSNGTAVDISENDADWIVLVPDKYRSQEEVIRYTIVDNRKGLLSSEMEITGHDPSLQIQQVNVRIIWIQSNQKVFSFDTTVNPSDNNMITDPIVEVMTNANSLTWDRLNSVSGDLNARLKVKLVNGNVQDTMRELQPLLKQLQLDDNLPYLVRVSDAKLQEAYDLQRTAASLGIASAVMLVVALLLEIIIVSISYAYYARRCVVRRLLGYGTLASQRESVLLTVVGWVAQSALGLVLAVSFDRVSSQNLLSRYAMLFVLTVLAIAVVEFLVMFVAMRLVESRSMVRQLKEL